MNEGALKAALEREERAYEDLVRVRASLGTMFAAAIRRDGGLPEFEQHTRDLPLLIRSADIRRTELKVELLSRQLKKAREEQRRAIEATKRAAAALEEARRSSARAANVEQKWSLETRRLEELHREEMARLERLRSEEPPGGPRSAEAGSEREEATEQPGRVEPQVSVEGAQEGTQRVSWWRRIFGG
jgi:hypothetical protein